MTAGPCKYGTPAAFCAGKTVRGSACCHGFCLAVLSGSLPLPPDGLPTERYLRTNIAGAPLFAALLILLKSLAEFRRSGGCAPTNYSASMVETPRVISSSTSSSTFTVSREVNMVTLLSTAARRISEPSEWDAPGALMSMVLMT